MQPLRITLMIAMLGGVFPAAAQIPAEEIGRLPSTLYLRNTFSASLPASPVTATQQVKNLEEITKNGTVAVFGSDTPAAVQLKAREFIGKNAKALELEKDASAFTLEKATETLSGRHISLDQRINGIRVLDGGIQLKVGPVGDLLSVTRNVVAVPAGKSQSIPIKVALVPSQAEDIAWNDIRVTGELLEPITTEKAYLNEGAQLQLVYVVRTAVSQPLGYWEHRINAQTGKIISRTDRKTPNRKRAPGVVGVEEAQQTVSREQAEILFRSRSFRTAKFEERKTTAIYENASAILFAPNPVSTLQNDQLKANDPAEAFADAYTTATVGGLTRRNGRLNLSNESVWLEDFEPGPSGRRHAPSTELAMWSSKRDNLSFHDVMSYYYVYTNLQYLRSLGYTGSKELFSKGVAIDSDGASGEDQSYFVPDSDRLVFGHGCVADNEDTDVILHEFGHAIHYHINATWGGGDARAIGEGFGDYWAVSHRARMKGGLKFGAGRVFLWDGIASCWPGRRTDRLEAKYDPNRLYRDHEQIDGIVSDELWSTPLVASLLELRDLGESFESVDIVVLEGMAAIGRNFTMRTIALKTVEVAHQLYPGRPHASVFQKQFRALGIIE